MSNRDVLLELIEHDRLSPLFQPIFDNASQTILGYEALIRGPAGHLLEFPDQLFKVAQEEELLSELELACRNAAIQRFVQLETDAKLFLNVNPNVLKDESHPTGSTLRLSELHGLAPERIIIELSERYPIDDTDLLSEAITHYRALGLRVAIDDLGAGYSGLKLWSELQPDFVKIDRYFIKELQHDATKKEFVQSIINLARNLNAKVIAEGIETHAELKQLNEMGIHLYQGFYLCRPVQSPPLHPDSQLIERIASSYRPNGDTIAQLAKDAPSIPSTTKAHVALDLFTNDKQLTAIPVVDNSKPVGMLRREAIMELFSGSYGRALYANKDVVRVMDKNPMIVDWQTPIDLVSNKVTDDFDVDIYKQFIVTQNSRFQGIASIRDLLRRITEVKVQNARYANPLTLLPGNVPIHRTISQYLDENKAFEVAYFDLNNFKPYNDVYGYSKGDRVISWVGELLREIFAESHHFIGHIGGDDFVTISPVAVTNRDKYLDVVARFEAKVNEFYSTADQARQYIFANDRTGERAQFPLLGIAIGIVQPDCSRCNSYHDVSDLAAEAKKRAKQQQKSACFFSHRRFPQLILDD